jgi:tetratricopeptide (TPR) repeat protein
MGHAVFKSNFGEKSPEYTNFLYDYAALQAEQASYDAALQNAEKTKTLRTQLFGENHPTTAQSIWLIAFINKKRGNFAAAIVAYQKAIQVNHDLLFVGQDFIGTYTLRRLPKVSTARVTPLLACICKPLPTSTENKPRTIMQRSFTLKPWTLIVTPTVTRIQA